jgi:hypothetical protein
VYDVEDHLTIVDTNTLIDVGLIFQWNPQDIAWSPDGSTLYVLARGSQREGFTLKLGTQKLGKRREY